MGLFHLRFGSQSQICRACPLESIPSGNSVNPNRFRRWSRHEFLEDLLKGMEAGIVVGYVFQGIMQRMIQNALKRVGSLTSPPTGAVLTGGDAYFATLCKLSLPFMAL
jgi:hypothetical protein